MGGSTGVSASEKARSGWGNDNQSLRNKAFMKKTYPLKIEGKNSDRVLDAIKHDIRKYVDRQRRVPLPEGVDFWDFDCQFGLSADAMAVSHFGNLIAQIDTAAKEGAESVSVFLLPKNGVRTGKPRAAQDHDGSAELS
jgi:hypothetical protein